MSTHPAYLAGKGAVAAWRALPSETRRWCEETAHGDELLTDLELAPIVTGYGHTMVRRNRWLLALAAAGVLVLSGALAIRFALFSNATHAIDIILGLAILACVGVIVFRAGPHLRYRTLRFWGLAALEKAQLAAAPAAVECPATTEIRFHRARMTSVTVAGWVIVLALAAFTGYLSATAKWPSVGGVIFAVVCVLLVVSLVSDIRRQRQYVVDPAFVRLTPDGWAFPGTDMRGDWSEVHSIEVRTGRAVGPRRFVHPGMRVVVLQLHDAQRHADNAHPMRRREAQADYRRYGSPTAFSVSYFFTITASDALMALRQYTPAPISWQ